MCEKSSWKGEVCEHRLQNTKGPWIANPTPEQYAAHAGYQYLHRKSILISGKTAYIVMEVSNPKPQMIESQALKAAK